MSNLSTTYYLSLTKPKQTQLNRAMNTVPAMPLQLGFRTGHVWIMKKGWT